jgi:hypothetical protein
MSSIENGQSGDVDQPEFGLTLEPHERSLVAATASIQNVRQSLTIHHEMFRRALAEEPAQLRLLQELLEDFGTCYLDLAERIIKMCRINN